MLGHRHLSAERAEETQWQEVTLCEFSFWLRGGFHKEEAFIKNQEKVLAPNSPPIIKRNKEKLNGCVPTVLKRRVKC